MLKLQSGIDCIIFVKRQKTSLRCDVYDKTLEEKSASNLAALASWQIGSLKYLETDIEKLPSRANQGQVGQSGFNWTKWGQTGPNGAKQGQMG